VGDRSKKKSRIMSPLEKLTKRLERKTNTSIDDLEVITPSAASPWWIPPITVISSSKETAEEAHKKLLRETDALIVYTDGSGINEKIGAAAVSPHRTIRTYLGPNTAFTVYSAELYGIILASILAHIPGHDKTHVIICIDNQAAIRAVENPGNSSGQHLVKSIVKFIDILRKKVIEIELHWVPAHIGIKGNEMADVAAKQATGWRQKKNRRGKLVEYDTNQTAKPAKLAHHLRSARKMALTKKAQRQWTTLWDKDETGRGLYALQSNPKKSVLKLHDGLTKDLSALAVQMRTGKIGLRLFLFRRRVPNIETERCQCRQAPQTVKHILFTCRKYVDLRRNLWKEEKKRKTWGELSLKAILTNPHSLKKAVTFMKETGLIGQFRAPIAEDY